MTPHNRDASQTSNRLRACGDCGHPWNVHGGVMADSGVYECIAEVNPHCACNGFIERPTVATTCLEAVWLDGTYRVRCSMGAAGVCGKHGPHKPHPADGRCEPTQDGYCVTHGVYEPPRSHDVSQTSTTVDDLPADRASLPSAPAEAPDA